MPPDPRQDPQLATAGPSPCRRLAAWIWSNQGAGEGRVGWLPRAVARIALIAWEKFGRDRIPLQASALTFTIVLAMVPFLALGTSVLKGLGAGDQMRQAAYALIEQQMGTLDLTPAEGGGARPEPGRSVGPEQPSLGEQQLSMVMHLKKAVDMVFDYVEKTNFAALGVFGVMGLVLAVLFFLSCIETAMNEIWQARVSRSLGRKLMDYLALMILLPLAINIGVGTMATLKSPALMEWLQVKLPGVGPLLLHTVPMLAVVATFTLLYGFLPNTKVQVRSAVVGGLVGGLFWLLVQAFYIKLQFAVARYNAIYGSFATLPLFMLWLYVGWMIFLGGAEVAFACQCWRRYPWRRRPLSPMARLALTFEVVGAMALDYGERTVSTPETVAEALGQPESQIRAIIDDLEAGGVIRAIVQGTRALYVPAGPVEQIQGAEIGALILGDFVDGQGADNPAVRAREAMLLALGREEVGAAREEE